MGAIDDYIKNRFNIDLTMSGSIILGLVNSKEANTLSFLDAIQYSEELIRNYNVSAVFTTDEMAEILRPIRPDLKLIIAEDPRYEFFSLQNQVARIRLENGSFPSVVESTAIIHPTACIASNNVVIGKNVTIEPNVTILRDVEIGDGTYISAGTVIGAEGFEHKRTSKGILSVVHDGKVIIGASVFIGALNAISKGFSFRDTLIGNETKTDNLVHIAHGAQIGDRCFLPASCMIAGSVSIGDDVWIGPNSTISNQITIGAKAFVSLGAVVTRNVPPNGHVSGNFAIPHNQFIINLKRNNELK